MPKQNVKEKQTGGRDYEDQQPLIWVVDKKDIWEMNMSFGVFHLKLFKTV